ncbi:MAG TPA: hypothetical protein PKW55_04640 [Spirochaetota bacterium]|nr:hypothetical protein [Spirochaetota bacterium]HOM37874.1 hypothetical protein [Spirochaetota bacterium]HPQ48678.1 hypothetical protein [Spirochaetota bacterium]
MKKNIYPIVFIFISSILNSSAIFSNSLWDKYIIRMQMVNPPAINEDIFIDILKDRYKNDNIEEIMIEGLSDSENIIKTSAIIYIGKYKIKAATSKLLEMLKSTNEIEDKKWIIWALGEVASSDDVLALSQYLRDEENPYILNLLAASISKIATNDGSITPLILLANNSKSLYIKSTAIIGIGKIGDPRAFNDIWQMAIEHPLKEIRFVSILALSRVTPTDKKDEIVKTLSNRFNIVDTVHEKLAISYTVQKLGGYNEDFYKFIVSMLNKNYFNEISLDLLEDLPFPQGKDRLEIIAMNYPYPFLKKRLDDLVVRLRSR